MAKRQKDVCPGCSRHCSANNVHCKYGRKHFEGIQKKEAAQADRGQKEDAKKHRFKWEKHVQEDGPVWKLLWVARRSKRALCRKKVTERELLAALDEAEQAQLNALLEKLSEILK